MYQSQEKRAWERGVRLAAIWKGIKKIFTRLDQRCVILAKQYKLPKWLGHIPLLFSRPLFVSCTYSRRFLDKLQRSFIMDFYCCHNTYRI